MSGLVRSLAAALFALSLLTASACREGAGPGAGSGAVGGGDGATLAARTAALDRVPAHADVVLTVDVRSLVGLLVAPLGQGADGEAALRADLARAFREGLGVNPLAADHVTVAILAQQQTAVAVIPGVEGGPLLGEPVGDQGAVRVPDGFVAGLHEGTLYVGDQKGVEAGLQVARGAAPALASQPGAEAGTALAAKTGGGVVVGTFVSPLLKMASAGLGLPGTGLDGVALAVGGDLGLVVVAQGDPATLQALRGLYDQWLGMARADLAKTRAALAGEPGALPRVGLAYLDRIEAALPAQVEWTLDGNTATARTAALSRFAGGGLPVVSVLATVAVPAFIKYQRRVKTTEAIDELDRIYKGAAVYYATPRVSAQGTKLPCQFPASAGPTPGDSPCEHPDGAYPGDPGAWNDPTWRALSFQVGDPHRFRYAFDSNGLTGAAAQFTASAHADLDCDGVWSTFQRMGFGDPAASASECSLQGSAAFYVENETE